MSDNAVEKEMPEFTDHWLWFVDEELVDRLMAPDEISPSVSIRPADAAAAGVALELQMQGRTRDAADEIERALGAGEPAADLYAMAGNLHFQLEEFDRAEQYFEKLRRIAPDQPAAGFNLGVCYERVGKYEEAIEAFTTAAAGQNQLWQAHVGLGYCFLRLGRYNPALEAFRASLELEPKSEAALFGMAVAFHFLEMLDEAENVYVQLLPAYSENAELLANLVGLAAARKDYVSLRDRSGDLLKIKPNSRTAVEGLLIVAFGEQNYPMAVEYSTKITELAPEDYQAWYNLGVAAQKAGLLDQAVTSYREALRINPQGAQTHANLGTVLQEQGALASAKASYKEALRLRADPDLLWNLALVCEQLGEPENAELAHEQVVAIKRDWADAWFCLGTIRFDRGEFVRALDAFESAAAARPHWPEALIDIGVCRYKLGAFEKARNAFEQALTSNPANLYALTGAVSASVAVGDAAGALEVYQQIRIVGDSLPELAFNVGLVLQQSGEQTAAIECYRDALAKWPDFPEALVNLGHALEAVGESREAEEHWTRAMDLAPELAATHFAGN